MNIITISREFGSGGRELGKNLAERLAYSYYDKEILTAIAQKSQLDENYIENILEKAPAPSYPILSRRTFTSLNRPSMMTTKLFVLQQQVMKELAMHGNCVIVGRGADVILQKTRPLNLFIYADMPSKMKRCRERAPQEEHLSDHELKKKIKQVDMGRKKYYELLSNLPWGDKAAYHLCVNTTGQDIQAVAASIADYAQSWFERNHL